MNELVIFKTLIENLLELEPKVRTLYPDLRLPNHFIVLLRRRLRETTLRLIEEEGAEYE